MGLWLVFREGCREVACEDVHGGTLTCAVGAEEANDLTLGDLKADIVYRTVVAVVFHQMFDFYHVGFSFPIGLVEMKKLYTHTE